MNSFKKSRLIAGLVVLVICCAFLAIGQPQVWGAGGAVNTYGQLKVIGNQLCDSTGNPVALRGMSLFWSNWDNGFYNSNVVKWLRDDWKCTVVRAAMGVEPEDAYLSNPEAQKQKVMAVVDAAINQGMYVIIDWHDHNAHNHTRQAKEFFAAMAQKYGSYPNVLYEIYNEPESVAWSTVKAYAEEVITEIRKYDPDNIIIVGTPFWSQYVDAAADNPINQSNIVYTLHFYAATHKQWLRDKATYAMNKGIALFVSEWGTSEATGDGTLDYSESDTWINFMLNNKLSWCNWSLFTKAETSAALLPGASTSGGWSTNQLSASGKYVREKLISLNNLSGPTATVTPTIIPSPTQTTVVSPTPTSTVITGKDYVVTYSQNDWGNGATVSVTIKNNSATPVSDWTLSWNFAGNQKITNLWNGNHTQNGTTVTVKNLSYNGNIPANGGTANFGFNISYSGTNAKPTAFTLNGAACQVQ